jgi:methionyl-tRNA formyltransferase
MRILVAGYGMVAQGIMRSLLEKHGVAAKDIFCFTYASDDNASVLEFLEAEGIRFSVLGLWEDEAVPIVTQFAPDFIASLYYRDIIPERILSLARKKAFNVHPALLPKFRGCFSGVWAIIHGETETGITIHEMVKKVDSGPILWQKSLPILPDDTGYSLYHRLCAEAVRQFDPFFERLTSGAIVPVEMAPGGSFFSRKVPFDGKIDPAWDDERVECFIRAMFFPPFQGAVMEVDGREIEINSVDEFHQAKEGSTSRPALRYGKR